MAGKSVLVIDTPTNCYECRLIYWGNIGGWNCKPTRALLDDANKKPEWCPLKPLPKEMEHTENEDANSLSFRNGWNSYYFEITGETE